jgi:hypothetical protein
MTIQTQIQKLEAQINALRRLELPTAATFRKHLTATDTSPSGAIWKKPTAGQVKVGAVAGCLNGAGYWTITFNYKRYPMSSVLMYMKTGKWREVLIDHIDRNPSNNDDNNLRAATFVDNAMNRKMSKNNTSGLVGCHTYFAKDGTQLHMWRLQGLKLSGRGYLTMEEAARDRDRAILANFEHLGASCGLNFSYSDYQ